MTIDRDEPTETERWLQQLDGPDLERMLRAYQMLAETGEALAVTLLRARVDDARPSGLSDERGWPLSHGDLAAQALRRLLYRRPELGLDPATGAAFAPGLRIVDPPATPTPVPATRGRAAAGHAAVAVLPRTARRPLSPQALAYGCLGLGLLAPLWALLTVFSRLTPRGLAVSGPGLRALALVAALPALAGLGLALKALLQRRPQRRREWAALALGLLLCARTLVWVAPDLLR